MDTETSNTVPAAPAELTEQQSAQIMARYRLEQQVLSGANNFFWIAGLTLVNSILFALNANWSFFIGLGATQFIDAIAKMIAGEFADGGIIFRVIGLGLDIFVAGMFVFFGVFARKRHLWAFVVGMILYGLDALLLLLIGEWVGLALHGLFLWFIFSGVRALRRLNALETSPSIIRGESVVPDQSQLGIVRLLVVPIVGFFILLAIYAFLVAR